MALIQVTRENYDADVRKSSKVVLLDFYADWCGPCKMIAPILEEIAADYPEITIGKVNVDECMDLAVEFKVTSIPLLVVVKDGEIINKALGAMPKEEILALLP